MNEPMHYCGYPDRRTEPTLCGIDFRQDGGRTTTQGADVTCPDCLDVLEGRKP